MPETEDLILQIAAGNREAFRLFYDLFQAKVYNTCVSYLKNNEEAEEATQDVFLEIYKSATVFRQESLLNMGLPAYSQQVSRQDQAPQTTKAICHYFGFV